MKFSVLMSVYHKEVPSNLKAALKSIWNDQLTKPSEIIIVKDGPLTKDLDSEIAKFESYAPAKVVTLDSNKGLGPALNYGLKHCSNELVARMDSDDISFPDRFKKQIDFFKENSDVSILGGQIIEFRKTIDNIASRRSVPLKNHEIYRFGKKRSPFNHPSVMFKKDKILEAGGYSDFRFLEDYHLWIRLFAKNVICENLEDDILYFRMSKDVIGRRHGVFYFNQELKLSKMANKLNFLTSSEYLRNIVIRAFPRLLPKILLQYIYILTRKI